MPPCILGQILQFLESVYYVLLDNVYFRVQCESERSAIDIWKWLCIEMYILCSHIYQNSKQTKWFESFWRSLKPVSLS